MKHMDLEEARQKHTPKLMQDDNIGAVGLGRDEDGEPALIVYTNGGGKASSKELDGQKVIYQKREIVDRGQLVAS